MLRKAVAVVAFVLVAVIAWEVRHHPAASARPRSASLPIAQFSLADINGQSIDSQQLKGKVLLIDFWATWCAPCQSEIPHFVDWQSRYGPQGLQVIGLSMDDTIAPVKAYVQERRISYPVAMADEKTIAAFGGVLGLPANIVIDQKGRMIAKHVGVTDIGSLEREIQEALKASND